MSSITGISPITNPSLSGLVSLNTDTINNGNISISANTITGIDSVAFTTLTVTGSLSAPQITSLTSGNATAHSKINALATSNLNLNTEVDALTLGNSVAHSKIDALATANLSLNTKVDTIQTNTQYMSANVRGTFLTGNLGVSGDASIYGNCYLYKGANTYNTQNELYKLRNQALANGDETTLTGSMTVSSQALSVPNFDKYSPYQSGTFTVSASSEWNTASYPAWSAVSTISGTLVWISSVKYTTGGVYTGTQTTAGYAGEWWQMYSTVLFSLATVQLLNNSNSIHVDCQTYYVLGSLDATNWTLLGTGSQQVMTYITNTTFRMNYVRIVITAISGVSQSAQIPHITFTGKTAEGTLTVSGTGNTTINGNLIINSYVSTLNVFDAGDPQLNLSGSDTYYGTLQFKDANGATRCTMSASSTSGNLNIDFQSQNGLAINSSGANRAFIDRSGNLSVNGNITGATPMFGYAIISSGDAPVSGSQMGSTFTTPNVACTSINTITYISISGYAGTTGLKALALYLKVWNGATWTQVNDTNADKIVHYFNSINVHTQLSRTIAHSLLPNTQYKWELSSMITHDAQDRMYITVAYLGMNNTGGFS